MDMEGEWWRYEGEWVVDEYGGGRVDDMPGEWWMIWEGEWWMICVEVVDEGGGVVVIWRGSSDDRRGKWGLI